MATKDVLILALFSTFAIIPLLFIGSIFYFKEGLFLYGAIEVAIGLGILPVLIIKRLVVSTRLIVSISLLYIFSIFLLITTGPYGGGFVSVFTIIILTSLIINKRKVITLIIINCLIFVILTLFLFLGFFDSFTIIDYKDTWLIVVLVIQLGAIGIVYIITLGLNFIISLYQDSYNQRKYLASILQSVNDGLITIDLEKNIKVMNKKAKFFFQVENQDVIEKKISDICDFFPYTESELHDDVLIERLSSIGDDIKFENHNPENVYYINRKISKLYDENSNHYGYIIVFRNITNRKLKEVEVEFLSNHDQLTGLYNRRFYETEIKRLDTERNIPISLIMGDVNGLKYINDTFGHAVGDQLLIKVANVIKSGFRADDIVCRLGGDEFEIILPQTTVSDAETIMSRITTALKNETVAGTPISVSFGVYSKNNVTDHINDVFRKSEEIMYQNKTKIHKHSNH